MALNLRYWLRLSLTSALCVLMLPSALLAAPPAGRLDPDTPRPPKLVAIAALPEPEPAPDFGMPLSDWLALVPDVQASRDSLVFGDIQAWFDETGIDRPATFEEAKALPEEDYKQFLFELGIQTEPPRALGLEYLAIDAMESRLGFGFFNTDQFLWSSAQPDELALLRVDNDGQTIGQLLAAAGYASTPMTGGTLFAKGEDYALDMNADFRLDQLGILNRVAVFPRAEGEADLLVARATGVISSALAAFLGAEDSLADDMGYRTLANAVDFEGLVPGRLVGLTVLGGEIPQLLPGDVPDWDARLAEYAREPLPPWRIAAFGTSRDGAETYLTLYLVLAPGESAQPTATILRDRLMDYTSVVSGRLLSDSFEVYDRGAFINELEVAYVTLRVLPGAETLFAWQRITNLRDMLFLYRSDEP